MCIDGFVKVIVTRPNDQQQITSYIHNDHLQWVFNSTLVRGGGVCKAGC